MKRCKGVQIVPAAEWDCSEFYGSVSVGTPSVAYNVILDTGSADLLLATSPCTGCESTTTLYTPADSSTSETSSTAFTITYVSPHSKALVCSPLSESSPSVPFISGIGGCCRNAGIRHGQHRWLHRLVSPKATVGNERRRAHRPVSDQEANFRCVHDAQRDCSGQDQW